MRTSFGPLDCQNLKQALGREWLETNGLGGFASSTIIGANTRRQHGLLVAALNPPVERRVLLSKFEEHVVVNGAESFLCTNLYPGTVYPHGFNIQVEFRLRPWPFFRYATADFEIEKNVLMVAGENTVIVAYRNVRSRGDLTLHLRPLLACRDYNTLAKRTDAVNPAVTRAAGGLSLQPWAALPPLWFYTKPEDLQTQPDWYYSFIYPIEQERGLDYTEDLFTPLVLTYRLAVGQTVYLVVSTETKENPDAEELVARERERRRPFDSEPDPARRALIVAADAFIARRGPDQRTVLAGYPWFTDWGRDAMIALPGLTLTTGRFEMALEILLTFARFCDRGMIPNLFPDDGQSPEYNAVDASLWFVVASWRYWKASGDRDGARQLLPALREVVQGYRDGTRFEIRADTDGLIAAGSASTQLTWMDVKVEGYVPTPRHGKAVEINALWLNALLMLAEMEEKLTSRHAPPGAGVPAAVRLRQAADRVAASFVKTFWYRDGGYLYDVVRADFRDPSIRPNQIFAASLPFSPLTAAQQRALLAVVTEHLLTPYGLRSLSPGHEKYVGQYTGNRWQRDCAYHQGTVWPWLIGAYGDAWIRVNGSGKAQRREIARLMQPLLDHLDEGGLGTIAEVFDGDPPHRPGGCFAQAWSVAEVLRLHDRCAR